MRNHTSWLRCWVLLGCALPIADLHAQDIVAQPIPKMPGAQVPGGGVQVNVYNFTQRLQRLRVRAPGGNPFVLGLPPNGGQTIRCAACPDDIEAALADEPSTEMFLTPGIEYEIRQAGSQGHFLLQERGASTRPR
ncbi:MAG TPA: hypothetical protein VN629_04150 [Castellaniella sp.]|nr:hypothetical protein [Castellaniella sp.]